MNSADAILLGIDVGTSSCKVAAFTREAKVVADETREYSLIVGAPGHVEQSPDEWWEAIADAIRATAEKVGPERIAGIGISGQSWSAIPMDESGTVLANTPIWMDTRSESICQRILGNVSGERILQVSGNRLSPSYTTAKIVWFQEHHPDIYDRTAVFLQSNSFIAQRLTGSISMDLSQGYGVHAWDTETGAYDEDLARDLGIDLSKLPVPVDCHEVVGTVTRAAAGKTGLVEGTPVVAGGLDAACGTLGAGVMEPGETQEQGGQAGGMSIVSTRPVRDPRLILGRHVVPGRWLVQGGTVAGGASLRWARDAFGCPDTTFEQISAEAAEVPVGSGGLWFLPYLEGERGPIWDPKAQGVLFGLRFGVFKPAVWRAVMEGVGYSLLDNVRIAEEAGAEIGEIYSVGGAASSAVWTQIKADMLGREIFVPQAETASCLGAAVLAGVGAGVYSSFGEARGFLGEVQRSYKPIPENTERYRAGFEIYQQLYRDLRDTMHRAADMAQ
ncbi:MAG: FGGY-family carbohydrate kinase [Actinomycetaceae bacterium]|nr:FGGY-family carbohydrate kinase [Actinomycetaceae bacterium]